MNEELRKLKMIKKKQSIEQNMHRFGYNYQPDLSKYERETEVATVTTITGA